MVSGSACMLQSLPSEAVRHTPIILVFVHQQHLPCRCWNHSVQTMRPFQRKICMVGRGRGCFALENKFMHLWCGTDWYPDSAQICNQTKIQGVVLHGNPYTCARGNPISDYQLLCVSYCKYLPQTLIICRSRPSIMYISLYSQREGWQVMSL